MKRIWLAPFVLCICASAQAQDTTVVLKAKGGVIEKNVTFILRARVELSAFTCDKTELEPADTSTCTVTLTRPAKFLGFNVTVSYPPELAGPTTVTVPSGQSSATFVITRPEVLNNGTAPSIPVGARAPLFPVWWAAWGIGVPYQAHLDLMFPCCLRLDHCDTADYSTLPCS